jgi:hypothetical protein
MFPKTHLVVSIFVVSLISLNFFLDKKTFLLWLVSAGIATILIDLDHLFFPLLKKEKRYIFRKIIEDPIAILKDLRAFRDEVRFPGLGWIRLTTHLLFSGTIFLLTFYFLSNLIVPVGVSLLTHLLMDLIDTLFLNPLRL